jgi:hypothetical protein
LEQSVPYFHFLWTEEIIAHLAEHDVSPDDFEMVVMNPVRIGKSRSSDDPIAWGYTEDGRYIIAVYQKIDFGTVMPVTAYEVPEPRR